MSEAELSPKPHTTVIFSVVQILSFFITEGQSPPHSQPCFIVFFLKVYLFPQSTYTL